MKATRALETLTAVLVLCTSCVFAFTAFGKLQDLEVFAPPLRAHGIEYWGCPMNGAFRYEPLPLFGDRLDNLRSWWSRCQRVGAAGFLVTSWEAYRLALELTTVVDAAAANFWR